MLSVFSIEGKNILVTGASSGIGREIAVVSSSNKGHVTITARDAERLTETYNMLDNSDAGNHHHYIVDLSDEDQLNQLVEKVDKLDGLVLNAGLVKISPVQFIKKDDLDLLFDVNIKSSILLVQKLLRNKKIKKTASIVLISSIATEKCTVGNAVYNATKGAVNAFTKSLALELASKKIRVNAILPGFVKTNILKDGAVDEENLDKHLLNYPLGRFGHTKDIAYLVQYLLSDASEWMTGSLIPIDGGFSLK